MLIRISLVLIILGIAWLSLTPKETFTIGNDKISHFIAYGVLMWNIGIIWFEHKKRFYTGIVLAILYGACIEIAQDFVPGRFMSLYDLLANTGGVLCGVLLTVFSYQALRKILHRTGII